MAVAQLMRTVEDRAGQSNLLAVASNQKAMASNFIAIASNLVATPFSDKRRSTNGGSTVLDRASGQ